MIAVLIRRANCKLGHTHRGKTMGGHGEKMAIYKPRKAVRRNQPCWLVILDI